jgi:hypothetical protein
MNILEHEIEDLICSSINEFNHDELARRGLPIYDNYDYVRQLDLGSYGRADLVGIHTHPSFFDGSGKVRRVSIQVFELKKDAIGPQTFWQAIRYVTGLKHKIGNEKIPYLFSFSIHLIGKSIDLSGEFIYLPDFIHSLSLYTYSLSLTEGLTFKTHNGYQLINPGFSNDKKISSIIRDNAIRNCSEEKDGFFAAQYMKSIRSEKSEEDLSF